MKTSSVIKKYWLQIFIYPIIVCVLFFASCGIFNFLLIPTLDSTIIGVTMIDVKNQTENIDTLFMGSSRVYRSVNSVQISENTGKNVFNIAYENANFYTTYYLLNEVSKTNNLETIFLEVSTTNFTRDQSSEDVFVYNILDDDLKEDFAKGINLDYNNCKLFEFTNYLNNFSNGRFVKCVKAKLNSDKYLGYSIKTSNTIYKGNGFMYAPKVLDSENELYLPISYTKNGKLWDEEFINSQQLEYFNKIIDFCKMNNINLVLFSPPYPSKITKDNLEAFQDFDEYILNITNEYGLKYLDFSKLKKEHITLTKDYFYNANHNNGAGAEALAPIISEIYSQLDEGIFNNSQWFYDSYDEVVLAYYN